MIENKFIKGMVIVCLAFLALLSANPPVFANVQSVTIKAMNGVLKDQAGTAITDGQGFVQLIKGSPSNPPTAKASASEAGLWTGDAYAVAVQPPITGDIKGTVGDYPGTPAGNGEFFLDNQLDHAMNTGYFMRYWTQDQNYYANSEVETPWAAGDPLPSDMDFGTFTLYKAAAPYNTTISKVTQTSGNVKQLDPDLPQETTAQLKFDFSGADGTAPDVPVQVKGSASHTNYYELRIKKGSPFSGDADTGDKQISGNNLSFTIDTKGDTYYVAGATYYARVAAFNYFGVSAGNEKSFVFADLGDGEGVPPLKITSVKTMVTSQPTDPGAWDYAWSKVNYLSQYTLTYYKLVYVKSSGYANMREIFDDINVQLSAAGVAADQFEVAEVDYWDPAKQGWRYAVKDVDFNTWDKLSILYCQPTGTDPSASDFYTWTMEPDAAPLMDEVKDGAYLYIGFAKYGAVAGDETNNYNWRLPTDVSLSPEFIWTPK